MSLEDQWSIGLLVLCIIVWGGGWVLSVKLARQPNTVIRRAFPLIALVTVLAFGLFVYLARSNVKG